MVFIFFANAYKDVYRYRTEGRLFGRKRRNFRNETFNTDSY